MIILYFCFIGFPLVMLILKIKNREYDDLKLFIWILIWIIGCTIFWYYMDWFTFDSAPVLFDPDYIRK
jgi:hypothetical protein